MATSLFVIKNMARLQAKLTPKKLRPQLKKNIRRATNQNALFVLSQIRKGIRAGGFTKNADLTMAIKGSAKPLVDSGDLFGALTRRLIDDNTAFVGLLRTSDAFNIGVTLHEGTTIKVTDKMRGLFFILWLASKGRVSPGSLDGRAKELFDRYKDWKPLNRSTTRIRVPARRFIDETFAKKGIQRQVVKRWADAVSRTWKEAK